MTTRYIRGTSGSLGGITAAEMVAAASASFGPCRHSRSEPVVLVTGEVVAAVCAECLAALPKGWGCDECGYSEVQTLAESTPRLYLTQPCEAHR